MKIRHLLLFAVIVGLGIWTIRLRLKAVQNSSANSQSHESASTQAAKAAEKTAPIESTSKVQSKETPNNRAAAGTVEPSLARPNEDWKGFLQKFDAQGNWTIQRNEQGRPLIVTGGVARLPQAGIKSAADWAKELAKLSGVPADQIRDTGEFLPETDFSRTYHLPQMIGDYLVDGAFIRVFERKGDGAIYYTALETQNVGEPDLSINISEAQAQGIVVAEFSKQSAGVEVVGADARPRILVTSPGVSELVWRLEVHVATPKHDEREVLVSAKSGRILRSLSLLHF